MYPGFVLIRYSKIRDMETSVFERGVYHLIVPKRREPAIPPRAKWGSAWASMEPKEQGIPDS